MTSKVHQNGNIDEDEGEINETVDLEKDYGITDETLFKNLEKSVLKRAEMSQRQMDFVRGILYGLIYGVLGNMAVQFGYQVFEEGVRGTYDQLFWLNSVIFLFSSVLIAVVTIRFKTQIDKLKESEGWYRKIAKSAIVELKRRNAKKANQK